MGCAHRPAPFFPLGVYGVQSTNDLPIIRRAGFNLVAGPATKPFLDAARANGLRVLASPGTSAGKNFDAQAARRAIAKYDSHPALWAWYLVDEPDLNLVAPQLVTNARRYLKSVGAKKPTALVIQNGFESLHYANISDIMMIDRYPIPWMPLANFEQHVRATRLALGKKKPLIAVLQTFNWNTYPELLPGYKDLRPPTYHELRGMTYSALAQGVNGLFYYAFDDGRWKIRDHPESWEALQRVAAEVTRRRPLFQAEHLWWPWRYIIKYKTPDRFNEALDSSIVLALLRVSSKSHAVVRDKRSTLDPGLSTLNTNSHLPSPISYIPPGLYIVAVNTTARNHTLRIYLPVLLTGELPVLDETRSLPIEDNWITDDFAPYAAHIYGPMAEPTGE